MATVYGRLGGLGSSLFYASFKNTDSFCESFNGSLVETTFVPLAVGYKGFSMYDSRIQGWTSTIYLMVWEVVFFLTSCLSSFCLPVFLTTAGPTPFVN